jgi:RNA polymerase sigma-70 factor (ECF subfamily)
LGAAVSPSERQTLVRAVAGDADALGELLQFHGPHIARELRRDHSALTAEDADDVMQVTFLEAFLHIRNFDPGKPGSIGGWLRSIARNNVSDLMRSRQCARRPPEDRRVQSDGDASLLVLLDELAQTSRTPSRAAAAHESRQVLEDAIEKLPESYRAVVRLCDLEGRPAETAAEAMGRTAGAVYMLRARAIDRLRVILGSESRFFTHGA